MVGVANFMIYVFYLKYKKHKIIDRELLKFFFNVWMKKVTDFMTADEVMWLGQPYSQP